MGDKTYSGKEALIALVNGMKLRISHWGEGCYIYMNEYGVIYTQLLDKVSLSTSVDYVQYYESIEPKQKHTYYRGFYRLRNSRNKCLYCTVWYVTENDMSGSISFDYEIVETETREF